MPKLKPALHWLGLLAPAACETPSRPPRDRAAARLEARCSAVTLEGVIVSAEGVVSGGSTETAERGLLGREREMAELDPEN